jgi:hypothetical protein
MSDEIVWVKDGPNWTTSYKDMSAVVEMYKSKTTRCVGFNFHVTQGSAKASHGVFNTPEHAKALAEFVLRAEKVS